MIPRNMVLITVLFAVSLTLSEVLGVQICGKQLADMLDLVCDGRGFHWVNREGRLPQIRKRNAVQYLITTPPPEDEGGIVTECCRKACSITDMESYCAASPGTFVANPTNAPLTRELANEIVNTNYHGQPVHSGQDNPPTTIPPDTLNPEGSISTSSRWNRIRLPLSSGLFRSPSRFFFVRPVGPRPTRSPVV